MKKQSAGLIMYRFRGGVLEVLLCHMGGPFWANRDEGAWTIPKGQVEEHESRFDAARREFLEETGMEPRGKFLELAPVKQSGGKTVSAWAFEGDCDEKSIESVTFEMEWPPHSGKLARFPEIDRAEWFPISLARRKIVRGQQELIDRLCLIQGGDSRECASPPGEEKPRA